MPEIPTYQLHELMNSLFAYVHFISVSVTCNLIYSDCSACYWPDFLSQFNSSRASLLHYCHDDIVKLTNPKLAPIVQQVPIDVWRGRRAE